MIIELDINGARVIITGENLSVSVTEDAREIAPVVREPRVRGIEPFNQWMNALRGRQTAIAEYLGITRSAVSQWSEVPADKLVQVEAFSGIDRRVLRPDLFEGLREIS